MPPGVFGNDPINFTDPGGLICQSTVGKWARNFSLLNLFDFGSERNGPPAGFSLFAASGALNLFGNDHLPPYSVYGDLVPSLKSAATKVGRGGLWATAGVTLFDGTCKWFGW